MQFRKVGVWIACLAPAFHVQLKSRGRSANDVKSRV